MHIYFMVRIKWLQQFKNGTCLIASFYRRSVYFRISLLIYCLLVNFKTYLWFVWILFFYHLLFGIWLYEQLKAIPIDDC